MCDLGKQNGLLLNVDYPDPDVIRVGDTYYMVSTTMYFMPGCEILSSKDLIHWKHETFVYETLDSTPGQTLEDGNGIYGQGMWAACIRYHKGKFYICFVANDTHKTYLYTSDAITGPWSKQTIEGFYHDCSILFDDDDRVYIVYGNKNIYLTELKKDLSGPKEGGLHRIIVTDADNPILGYEGSHLYKINGKYYVFFIHSLPDHWRRTEDCFVADSLEGEFVGKEVFNEDIGYCGQGVAQGGIVDTPDGKWYAILFQDRGAVGRLPVLVPVAWENDFPVFGEHGKMPVDFKLRPQSVLTGSDDFRGAGGLKSMWQFNHEPVNGYYHLDTEDGLWIVENEKICTGAVSARNTITQRMTYPSCTVEVTLDASLLKDGDIAGLCILQYLYGLIGIKKSSDRYFLFMLEYVDNGEVGQEIIREQIPFSDCKVRLRIDADFEKMKDTAQFFYQKMEDTIWTKLGCAKKLSFSLKHFTGCRAALVSYATKEIGGKAQFCNFIYKM